MVPTLGMRGLSSGPQDQFAADQSGLRPALSRDVLGAPRLDSYSPLCMITVLFLFSSFF